MAHSTKGQFLIASPSLVTPFFSKTVILMFEHNDDGAMGVVINRATRATVAEIAEQVFSEPLDWDKEILLGGPVPGPLLVLHSEAHLADQTVIDGVYSSVDPAKVEMLLRGNIEPCLVVANYSGWGPGQLEGEMAEDSWLVCPASDALVFSEERDELWDTVVALARHARGHEIFGINAGQTNPEWN